MGSSNVLFNHHFLETYLFYESNFLGQVKQYEPSLADILYGKEGAISLAQDINLTKLSFPIDEDLVRKELLKEISHILLGLEFRIKSKVEDKEFVSYLVKPVREDNYFFLRSSNGIFFTCNVLVEKWDIQIIIYTLTEVVK